MVHKETLATPLYVIDDDPALASLIYQTLAHKGFTNIHIADTGESAMVAIKSASENRSKVDATEENGLVFIILDIMLPDISGFELCCNIKEMFSEVVVLMISGYDIDSLHNHLIECGADDFLTKPFSPMELAARTELLIEKHYRNKRRVLDDTAVMLNASGHQVPHIGDKIDDFLILDSLGWGKSSIIYKVVAHPLGEIFALKLLTKYSLDFCDVVERFQYEIAMMAQFDHPNIIKFLSMGNYGKCPYFLMEYLFGINLEESLVTMGVSPFETILSAAHQIASGLEAVHSVGIVHCDIKLKNIMVEPQTNLFKLTDFGIARSLEEGSGIRQDGFIMGTPIYMAPEIFGGDTSTIQSDIYSYGVTMYQFASGIPPFSAQKNSDIYKKHIKESPKSLNALNTAIPQEFSDFIIDKCMAKEPEDRPASMHEVINTLEMIDKQYSISDLDQ